MEEMSERFQADLIVAGCGVDSDGTEDGLADCGDMNRKLAQMASAKSGDIYIGLLDEIFQNVSFSGLLGIRRVCKGWKLAISRESAPFLRDVVIPTEFFRFRNFSMIGSEDHEFWSLANKATTLIVCGSCTKEGAYDLYYPAPIVKLWDSYKEESQRSVAAGRINKVIYANMVLSSDVFRCRPVYQLGFQTMLYHSTLKLPIVEIFRYVVTENAEDEDGRNINFRVNLTLKVQGPVVHTLNEPDLEIMMEHDQQALVYIIDKPLNPVTEYFVRKNCTYVEDSQLDSLTAKDFFKDFGSVRAVRNLVEQLINRFEPGNEIALSLFNQGDSRGFTEAAPPIVSVLLHRFVEDDMNEKRCRAAMLAAIDEVTEDLFEDYSWVWEGRRPEISEE